MPGAWAWELDGARIRDFGSVGDAWLTSRAVLLAETLAHKPGSSIPSACQNWREEVAAYRFLSHKDVGWDDVMQDHWQTSEQRIGQHPLVLCLQRVTLEEAVKGPVVATEIEACRYQAISLAAVEQAQSEHLGAGVRIID